MKKTYFRQAKGFTLVEILVVAAIMVLLTTIAVVSYRSASQNSRNAKRKTDLEAVRQALVLYRSDEGCYPGESTYLTMLAEIDSYISSVPYDPKGTPSVPLYTYTPSGSCGTGDATGFTLGATLEPSSTAYTVSNP